MSAQLAGDLFKAALVATIRMSAPALGLMTAVAIIFGILQAATQIQDASVAFTPKLIAAFLVAWLLAAWTANGLTEFVRKTLDAVPWIVGQP
jgi:flagellar biosynthetic protein FliQ